MWCSGTSASAGSAGNGSVAPDRAGRYFTGYQRMVDELIDAAGAGRVAHTFTSHIHRDWHKPGILPEIADGVTRDELQSKTGVALRF